jgi:hypothetical protein
MASSFNVFDNLTKDEFMGAVETMQSLAQTISQALANR